MFTGIVEETGTVRQISVTPDGARLTIEAVTALEGTRVGDSIAMNGACLTVVTRDDRTFAVEATLETLRRTNLGELGIGDRLHLERALAVGGRFGGHFMQGHVDGTGTIRDRQTVGDAVVQSFSAPPEIVRYLVPKGSISVDGVSLTVVNVGADWFDVWLIPHTLDVTLLTHKPVGATVNLEADILAKYVARAVEASLPVPISGSA
ncbi:MAG: riboflavin synthase [Chloroflexi bacterium]|nr:riboflavin synthase [Chloroflexota bacterium]